MVEAIGFLAASLVLATFLMRSIHTLRLMAIASHLAFMLYGCLAAIEPVPALHAALLPVNLWRYAEPRHASQGWQGETHVTAGTASTTHRA